MIKGDNVWVYTLARHDSDTDQQGDGSRGGRRKRFDDELHRNQGRAITRNPILGVLKVRRHEEMRWSGESNEMIDLTRL